MAADGQIVLGLNISETTSQIEADLSSVLGNMQTKQLILRTRIEKNEAEKSIQQLVKEINSETAEIGIKVNNRDVSSVLNQQKKIASTQDELNRKMEQYKTLASEVGLTLKESTQQSFKSAIDSKDFDAAKESLRAVKREIEDYNSAVSKMNADTKLDFDINSIVGKFATLKTSTVEVKTLFDQLKVAQDNFSKATTNSDKLKYYNEIKSTLSELEVRYQAIHQAESQVAANDNIKKSLQDTDTLLKNLKTTYATIGDSQSAQKLKQAIDELEKELQRVNRDATGGELAQQWVQVSEKINAAKRAVSEYKTEQSVLSGKSNILDNITEKLGSLQLNIDTSGIQGTGLTKLYEDMAKIRNEAEQLKGELSDLDPTNGEDVTNLTTKIEDLQKRFESMSKSANVFKDTSSIQKFSSDIDKARQKVNEYASTYSAIKSRPELVKELERLKEAAQNISTPAELKQFNSEFDQFNSKVVEAGVHCKSFGDQLKTAFKNFSAFFSASRVIYQVIASLKQMVANVKELDTAMVELRKVTDASETEFNQFLAGAKTNAVELGSTITDLVNATSDFSRLGYSLKDAEELGRVATIYANVGDDINDISQATTSLVSTMKGFGLEAEDAMSIIDKFNEVGNNFAISSGGIGDALQRSAASLAAANNSIDQSIALIVAANNVIQDPAVVGTMWKTVAMRIRGATTELEQAGLETEGMAKSTADLREQIMALTNVDGKGGFDIMLDEDTFKSTYDIILGIGQVWKDISDIDQAALLELLAGKRQGNALAAALTNLEDLQKALEASENSAGSAMKEQEVWLNSLEAKINQFKAAFESLSSTVVSDDLLKGLVDAGTGFLTLLDNIIQGLGGMGNSLLILVDIIAMFNFSKTVSLVQGFWNSLKTGFGIVTKVKDGFQLLQAAWQEGRAAGGGFITQLKTMITALTGTATAATVATAAIMAIVAAIAIGILAYQNYKRKQEETRRELIEAGQEAADNAKNIKELAVTYLDYCDAVDAGTASIKDANSARDNLIAALDLEEGKIQELIGVYHDYKTAIIEAAREALRTEISTATSGAEAAKKQATEDIDTFWSDRGEGVIWNTSKKTDAVDALTYLKELGYAATVNGANNGGSINMPHSTIWGGIGTSLDFYDMLENYQYVEKALNDVREKFGASNPVTKQLAQTYQEYAKALNPAIEAIKTANETIANDLILAERAVSDPSTQEEFEQFRNSIINNLENHIDFDSSVGSADSVVDAIFRENDQYKQWLDELDQQQYLATEIQSKRRAIAETLVDNNGYDYHDKESNWHFMEQYLNDVQRYKDKLAELSDEDFEIAYDLVINQGVTTWDDVIAGITEYHRKQKQLVQEKGFEAIKSSVESVANAHKELNTVLANGDSLTESAYQALVTLVGGEEALAESVDVANGYLITNADNLNDLVDAATEAAKADLKLAESQQMLKHHELVKTLKSVCDGLEDYDEGTMAVVSSLLEQIDATELQIAQYKLLEQQILGATNAFDKMANAKAIDTARDYTDDLAESISGLISSFENHEFGTEYFKTAFESLIPEDIYSQFTEAGDQLDAGWDYLNTKLARYFSFENGSASIDFGNVKTFVQDALNTAFGDSTVFTGTLEKFDLNPQITSVQELADAMGVTTTVAFSMANAISKYTTDNDDFLSKLSMDGATLETQMLACDQQMAQLLEKQTQLGKSGQVGTEEWEALQADIAACNQQMSDLQQKARENISANIKVESDIVEKQQEVDDLKAQLDGLDEHSAYYQAVLENYEQAQKELDTLIQKKYNLEEPTSITIEVALEQVQSEIDQTKTELQKIADYDGESYHLKAECSADSEQFDLLVEKLATLEQEQTEIMVYAGIDDEDAMNGLETIEEFKINDKKFSVQANTSAALNALQNVINTLARIQSKTVTVTTITREQKSSKAYGNANYRGTAHEHGVWGTKTAEKNALLGELGEEIVVDPRTGVWQTVGENGAVLMNLPEGAIVFNHRQTEQLLKNRRIDSRGKAYAWGNAHFSGFGDNGGYTFGTPTSNPKTESIRTSTPTTPTTTVPVTIQPTVDNKTLEEQLEETLEKMQDTIDDVIGNYEHEIFLKEKKNAPVEEIVAIYKSMQQYVHEQANAFRELGLDENSDYIQNLQKQWWDYQENIVEAMTDAYNEVTKQHENAITLNQNWLDNAIKANDYEGVVKYTSNIIEHYKQMQQNIHEQAEYYRSLRYSDTSDEISELSDLWWDYQENIENAMADAFQQIVDNAHDALDDIQGFYDTLKGAAKEYAESGYITVDTLQEICKYGVQYLAFLQDENGQLVINEQSIQNLIAARTRQMAVETALNYVQQIRTALMNNDAVALNNLLYATDAATSSTWELVYAQLELLNLNSDQYNAALQRINALRSLSEVAVHSIGAVDGSLKQTLQDTQSALEDILKYVEAMIKQEVQNQIDALKQQVSDMKEIVNLQKQSLDLERKKDSYTKSIKDKTKELADLQKQLALQELDTSRDSQARQLELREKIAKLSDDIADEQADHAYDATSDMLDDMADAYEKEKDKEIKVLEDSISSEEKLYQLAIQRINTQWDSLYEDLIAWNTQYGTVINDDLTAAWNNASRAVQEYGSYLQAVQRVQAEINAMDTAAYNVVGNTDGLTKQDHETKTANTEAAKREVRDIVNEARMYSASWSPTNSQESKDWLHQQVADRFKELEKYGIYASFNAASGVWTITRDDLDPKNVGKTIYAAYHKGGVVGEPTLKQDEEFAKLKKGEIVVTKEQQEPIFRLLDFSETMLSKYGQLFNAASGSDMMASRMEDQIKRDGKQAQSIVENSNNSFNIEVPVQIHTVQKLDEREISDLTRKVSKHTMNELDEMFSLYGKRNFRP